MNVPSNGSAVLRMAEIISPEPDPDYAGEGSFANRTPPKLHATAGFFLEDSLHDCHQHAREQKRQR